MEFINIGPAHIRGCKVGWVVAKIEQGNMVTIVEFRVAMTSICTHKGPKFHYKA